MGNNLECSACCSYTAKEQEGPNFFTPRRQQLTVSAEEVLQFYLYLLTGKQTPQDFEQLEKMIATSDLDEIKLGEP